MLKELKPFIFLAHLFFAAMFAFAAVFYVERICYIDNSFFLFKILSFKTFDIEAYRYSEAITQILPLLAMKLKLSLKFIVLSYSISFVIVYYLIFLINVYVFKNIKAGISTTLVMILGISDSAFYPATEIEFGVVLCILFYAYLEYYFKNSQVFSNIKSIIFTALGCFLVLLCLFSHPATILPVLFILVFEIINYKTYFNKGSWLLLIFILLVYFIKLFSIGSGGYEGSKIEPLKSFMSIALHIRNFYSWRFFLKYIEFGIYTLPLVLMATTLLYYFIKGQFLKLIYYGLAILGCSIFLLVTHSPGETDIGMERNILPLWVLAAVPFVHDFLLGRPDVPYVRTTLFGVIILAASIHFYRAAVIYNTRTSYLREILKVASETKSGTKFVLENKSLNMDIIMSNWSIANESLILSSLEGKNQSKTIYLVNDISQFKSVFDFRKRDIFLSVPFWLEWPYTSLNHDYFNLPDEPYQYFENKIPLSIKP